MPPMNGPRKKPPSPELDKKHLGGRAYTDPLLALLQEKAKQLGGVWHGC